MVGALTAVTCLIYFVPLILRSASLIMVIWDFILFVLWIALFGVFGKVCLCSHPLGWDKKRITLLSSGTGMVPDLYYILFQDADMLIRLHTDVHQ